MNLTKRRRGEERSDTVLTDALVRSIRRMHKRGMSQRAIAAAIGRGHGAVRYVIEGKTWMHVV